MFSVDVSPDMNMYTLLINQAYEPSFALCEFIDNAIHAQLESNSKEPLEITVRFYSNEYMDKELKNTIIIEDNGPGISETNLKTALKPARRPSKKGLSEFGIGMKAASVWFADEWELFTWPKDSGKELTCKFNLPSLLKDGKNSLSVFDSKASTACSGTKIVLSSLRRDISEERYNEIINNIENIYQRFIGGPSPKVIIKSEYNGIIKTLKFSPFPSGTLNAPKHFKKGSKTYRSGPDKLWKVHVNLVFKGAPINGFIEIKSTGSYPNNPGLVLFRHNRVVCGLPSKKYIPTTLFKTSNKHRAMRVYGELNLDEVPVSYTKDKFNFDDDEFCRTLIENTHGLSELLTQADNYRVRNVDPVVENQENTQPKEAEENNSAHTKSIDINNDVPNIDDVNVNVPPQVPVNEFPHSQSNVNKPELNIKKQTRIEASNAIIERLNELGSLKFSQLYNSLCTISLEQHPALMYVGAWAFFESLAKNLDSSTDFNAFFGSKMNHWGYNREQKKSIGRCLSDISDEGNCVKHDGAYVSVDAKKLAHHFKITEPLILKALDDAIQKIKTAS